MCIIKSVSSPFSCFSNFTISVYSLENFIPIDLVHSTSLLIHQRLTAGICYIPCYDKDREIIYTKSTPNVMTQLLDYIVYGHSKEGNAQQTSLKYSSFLLDRVGASHSHMELLTGKKVLKKYIKNPLRLMLFKLFRILAFHNMSHAFSSLSKKTAAYFFFFFFFS